MRAIRIHETGGPETLQLDEIDAASPGPGELRVRVAAAGVNFIDVYLRTGLYPPGPLPARVGKEGAGTVAEVGEGVDRFRVGDRVAFFDVTGSYAEEIVLPAARALPLPSSLPFDQAAALPLQGMTADYLVRTIGKVAPGDVVLVHAAAGGVGRLAAARWRRRREPRSTAPARRRRRPRSREPPAATRRSVYTAVDFADELLRLTSGRGADLVLDSVGQATFAGSVRATRVRGTLVLFGQSSGMIAPFSPRPVLGSRTLVTAMLFDYTRQEAELGERWARVVDDVERGRIALAIDSTFPLADAAAAHRRLESRASSGKIVSRSAERSMF